MGILNRWRQFGRRYFWPYLLLGVVAASLGLPTSPNETNEHASASNATASVSRQNPVAFSLTELVSLKEVHRRTSFSIDYWHNHVICTVISHLSFVFALIAPPQAHALPKAKAALSAHLMVILDTLNALLTLPETPSALHPLHPLHPLLPRNTLVFSAFPHHIGLWLSQVRGGIRAEPASSA
ncbi:MAG: secA translation cis-regulator SecM [Symbiopectobacterium sp.]